MPRFLCILPFTIVMCALLTTALVTQFTEGSRAAGGWWFGAMIFSVLSTGIALGDHERTYR